MNREHGRVSTLVTVSTTCVAQRVQQFHSHFTILYNINRASAAPDRKSNITRHTCVTFLCDNDMRVACGVKSSLRLMAQARSRYNPLAS